MSVRHDPRVRMIPVAQINVLNQHVETLQQEFANARRFYATPGDNVSFRHLGARAEQILALAEEQATEIRERATRDLVEREAEVARARTELEVRAQDAANNFEQALAARRAEEDRETALRREALANEVETAEDVVRVIEDVLKFVPKGRIIATTNCGMAPMRRDIAEAKLVALGAGAKMAREKLG